MNHDQIILFAILAAAMAAFIHGRWRHDMVAIGALLAGVAAGLVPADEAFSGLGHPAVVTVAGVLVLSRMLQDSGAIEMYSQKLLPSAGGPLAGIATLTALGAALSAFMNNVGALALLMPLAIQLAVKHKLPPGKVLMPLSFGTILGGMTTLIGTPPNLVVSGFRARTAAGPFSMFDFTPIGIAVATAGVLFLVLLGIRLVPARERSGVEGFDIGAYITEARVPEKAKAVGMTLREVEARLGETEAQVVGLIRDETRLPGPHPSRKILAGDILIVEGEPGALASALAALGLTFEEDRKREPAELEGDPAEALSSDDVGLAEFVVVPDSDLVGRSSRDLRLRTRYDINLIALSRQGRRSMARLRTTRLVAGDVLLLQGQTETLGEFATLFGCLPLAARPLRIHDRKRALTAVAVMAISIAVAAYGLAPAAIAFAGGVLLSMVLRTISLNEVYSAIDWPVIILLAALLPLADAMSSTGAADFLANTLFGSIAGLNPLVVLTVLLVFTMTLSDFMNNVATAAMICPIALGTAATLGISADPLLMAVAIGASCAFLTPIGHQNNTLILGPGGLHFGDYWRLGLPLEILVVVVAVPLIPQVWPF